MILKAAWIAPVASPPIRDGYVACEAGRIMAIGSAAELPASADVEDLGDVVLTPGLVNAHTHLDLTCYAKQLPRAPLWPWISALLAKRREAGELAAETEAAGLVAGVKQSLRAGVTCVGDISRSPLTWSLLKPLPIRKVCFVELITIAQQPPRTIEELATALAAIETDERLNIGISPHAPYSVKASEVQAAIALANERGIAWTMHWAETPQELAFLNGDATKLPEIFQQEQREHDFETSAGASHYLQAVFGHHQRGLLAHANYTPDESLPLLAQHHISVAYCPRAHAFYGHPHHPYKKLRDAGITVALATDSLASNESLSLLDECRYVWEHDPQHPSASDMLEMITRLPAEALGLGEEIGTLEMGKQADLAAFALADATILREPLVTLIQTAPPASAVWLAGQRISI